MRLGRAIHAGVLATLVAGAALAAQAPPAKAPTTAQPTPGVVAPPAAKLRLRTVDLHIFHRVFPDFHDHVDAALNKEFRIGDTEYTGTVIRFVPDFTMDLKTGKISSRSQEPKNPAFRLVVKKNGVPQDSSWAFLNMAPHFGQRSLIAFLAVRATFENHGPVASRDTLAVKLLEQEKH
jgi:hypothetical protein